VADVAAGTGERVARQVVPGIGAAQAVDVVDAGAGPAAVEGPRGAVKAGAAERGLQISLTGRGDAGILAGRGLVADRRGERVTCCDGVARVGASACRDQDGQGPDDEERAHVPSRQPKERERTPVARPKHRSSSTRRGCGRNRH